MSLTQEKALFQLSGKLKLADLSTESLQKMTDLYPYFIPARFFLAAKERASTNKGPLVLAQKANLYFTNPHWLWYQLEHSEKNLHTLSTATTPPLSKKPEVMAVPTVEAVKDILRKIDPAGEQKTDNTKIDFSTETESRIADILSGQLAAFNKPIDPNELLDIELEKQRLHTIDYFASQGIKIDLSSIPQDKLTRNLLKFTDWLKQIKQVNPAELISNIEMEKAVAETAKNSNETREILTETMAEVFIKQGQKEKAIQLLIKLSFLNPEKSSYFAAKIEQLKGI
ncbi:MAG: hypothetical protein M0Q26_09335 [Chitinophagaceae bacterium]|nr:hypothetical protein [Chitinophagaceae bacterium]MDP1765046.1 hypothetical protein [Sediminibacterium sp.]MDP1810253.1 hypothetical protein [Sediminibacterium sp.]MDP3128744.1 hypothetical protein [Sediminibacterium sp.]